MERRVALRVLAGRVVGSVWPGRRGWEAWVAGGGRGFRRIHRAKIKSRSQADVPGGDLFLWEADARACIGRLAFNKRIRCGRAAPPTSGGARVLLLPLLVGGVFWSGQVPEAGGGWGPKGP